jgi:hypothetical protein
MLARMADLDVPFHRSTSPFILGEYGAVKIAVIFRFFSSLR